MYNLVSKIDVATFEEPPSKHDSSNGAEGDASVSIDTWSPSGSARTLPFQFATDTVEVSIYNSNNILVIHVGTPASPLHHTRRRSGG
jgi:hypothetical protein